MFSKKSFIKSFFILFIGVVMGCSFVGGNASTDTESDRKITHLSKSEEYEMLQLFGKVYELAKQEYVEEVGEKELLESAMDGMLSSLDPHSEFLTAEEYKEMNEHTNGEFGGLGMVVTKGKMGVMVINPIDDTPAFKAKIQSGDYITHIDDEQISELSLSEAVKRLKGKPGTKIKLTIFREGEREPLKMTLKRAVIKVDSVKTKLKRDGKIGYIRMSIFDSNTDKLLKKGIAKLQKKEKDSIKGYVLDLRNNSGGLLPQAIAVVDAFITSGEIVSTRPRDKEKAKSYFAENNRNAIEGDLLEGAPLVVLINQGSASASEIVAGALQDYNRAIIVGVKSYGKGSVQSLIQVTDETAVRMTTSRYYLPSGRSIQAKGITPDVEVKHAKIEESKVDDEMFSEASKANALDAKKKKKDKKKKTDDNKDDYQLERAMDLIQGVAVLKIDKK